MLWFVPADGVRDYKARLQGAGGDGPVAVAMPMTPNAGKWLTLAAQYLDAGADLLILTSYLRPDSVISELEEFAHEVLPRLS